jgi:hypothetical protein
VPLHSFGRSRENITATTVRTLWQLIRFLCATTLRACLEVNAKLGDEFFSLVLVVGMLAHINQQFCRCSDGDICMGGRIGRCT